MLKKVTFTVFISLLLLLGLYSFFIEPRLLIVNKIELGNPTATDHILKIIQLSDIQISEGYPVERLKRVVDKVNNEHPDIIVFTGDLFDNYNEYSPSDKVITYLRSLDASIGKYAVWGNHDYGGGAVRIFEDIMTDSDFNLLRNEGELITLENGKQLYLGGLDDSLLGNPSVELTLSSRSIADYTILLTHEPDVADTFTNTDTQLVLAGHSHGGQISLPLINIATTSLAVKYTKGLYELNNNMLLYVNTGLGTSRIHARFNVIPEITLFNLSI